MIITTKYPQTWKSCVIWWHFMDAAICEKSLFIWWQSVIVSFNTAWKINLSEILESRVELLSLVVRINTFIMVSMTTTTLGKLWWCPTKEGITHRWPRIMEVDSLAGNDWMHPAQEIVKMWQRNMLKFHYALYVPKSAGISLNLWSKKLKKY